MKNVLHKPVLLAETLECLSPTEGDRYLDLTAGFGGHASQIAGSIGKSGRLTLVDRDMDAIVHLKELFKSDSRTRIIHDDFLSAAEDLLAKGEKFDLVLADLGVSSYQLEQSSRGFSFDESGPVDMRMDKSRNLSAKDVVNGYDAKRLKQIFREYGELSARKSSRLVEEIIRNRPINSTDELADAASTAAYKSRKRIEAQVFQAIRIEVNDELNLLKKALPVWEQLLASGGRLTIISFHSLEDRIVKQFFVQKTKDRYESSLRLINKKPTVANKNETVYNPRARSAKLRAAVKK